MKYDTKKVGEGETMRTFLLLMAIAILNGCATKPSESKLEQVTVSKAVNGVKCNLAHYFVDAPASAAPFDNFLNERFTIGKVSVEMTFGQTNAVTQGGELGLTIPIGGPISPTLSGGVSNKVTSEGSFVPQYTFQIISPLKKNLNAPDKLIPKSHSELEDDAASLIADINATIEQVCDEENRLRIVFPVGFSEGGDGSGTAADDGLALTRLLLANKAEIEKIVAGGPRVSPDDFTIRTALTAIKTAKAGIKVNVLVLSFGLSTQSDRTANFVLKITFDLVESAYSSPIIMAPG